MKQKRPKSVNEPVSSTFEMESYLVTSHDAQVKAEEEDIQSTLIASVQSQQGTMMDMMKTMHDGSFGEIGNQRCNQGLRQKFSIRGFLCASTLEAT